MNHLASEGIYIILCSCGAVCNGETGHSIKTHLYESQLCPKSGLPTHSAVAEHQDIFFFPRIIRAALEIPKHSNISIEMKKKQLAAIWKTVAKPHSLIASQPLNKLSKTPRLLTEWFGSLNGSTLLSRFHRNGIVLRSLDAILYKTPRNLPEVKASNQVELSCFHYYHIPWLNRFAVLNTILRKPHTIIGDSSRFNITQYETILIRAT